MEGIIDLYKILVAEPEIKRRIILKWKVTELEKWCELKWLRQVGNSGDVL
jgi:hypothetical protein